MYIYCTGTISNNGTISMTARGAKAEGQNVYLFKNLEGTYEYVPKVGGTGGGAVTCSSGGRGWWHTNGINRLFWSETWNWWWWIRRCGSYWCSNY